MYFIVVNMLIIIYVDVFNTSQTMVSVVSESTCLIIVAVKHINVVNMCQCACCVCHHCHFNQTYELYANPVRFDY